jgi:hypothetical protein
MRPLSFLERSIERVFERSSARIFRAPVHRVVVERRLERAMEERRRRVGDRVVVPDAFVVELRPADLDALASEAGGPEELARALASSALTFARAHGYTMRDLPTVTVVPEPDAPAGDARVAAIDPADSPGARGASRGRRSQVPEGTMVLEVSRPPAVNATLAIREPGAPVRTMAMGDAPVVIGRDAGCDIVLADPRASRQHARIASRSGFLVLSDLGSTNGTYVRDVRIAEIALGPGDVVTIGDSTIEVGRDPAPRAGAPVGEGR